MKTLLVEINGKRLCLAGVASGHVFAMLSLCTDEPSTLSLYGNDVKTQAHLAWPAVELSTGDEVTIRLVEIDSADEPEVSGSLPTSNT